MIFYHAPKIFVGVEAWKMFLVAAVEACVWEIDSTGEVVVEILVVAHRIIFTRCVHYFGHTGIIFTKKTIV